MKLRSSGLFYNTNKWVCVSASLSPAVTKQNLTPAAAGLGFLLHPSSWRWRVFSFSHMVYSSLFFPIMPCSHWGWIAAVRLPWTNNVKVTMGMFQEVFKRKVFVQVGNKQPEGNNRNHNMTNILPEAFSRFFNKKKKSAARDGLHRKSAPWPRWCGILTLCSSRTQLRTCRQASTPSSSKGRCNGKSTVEKRELSGRAKVSERLSSWGSTSTSTRLWPANGTGERSNR